MKRPLAIIALCLLLGAVVNVAVAWGASISTSFSKLNGLDLLPKDEANTLWQKYVGAVPDKIIGERGDGLTITITLLHRLSGGDQTYPVAYMFVQSGWPTRSMEGSRLTRAGVGSLVERRFLGRVLIRRPSLSVEGGVVHFGWVPLRPTLPGFAINTIFYASLLWLLIPGPFVLRRFLRLRRGLCPKCAYPMGESAVCTECGIALPRRRRMATLT